MVLGLSTIGLYGFFNGSQPLVKRWNGNDPSLWSMGDGQFFMSMVVFLNDLMAMVFENFSPSPSIVRGGINQWQQLFFQFWGPVVHNGNKCHEMPNVMKFQTSWNVKCHGMWNVMKCQMSWNVKCHEMSNVIKFRKTWNVKSQMSWNDKWHEMSRVMKRLMSWYVKCHDMSNVMICQMS